MCNVFWRVLKTWCKSFTRTELWLCLAQAILLAVLIACLILLILHLLVCPSQTYKQDDNLDTVLYATLAAEINPSIIDKTTTVPSSNHFTTSSVGTVNLLADIQCTWQPSQKTEATAHYYLTESSKIVQSTDRLYGPADVSSNYIDDMAPNGDNVPDRYKQYVAALVKLKPPADVTFGCILTKVSVHWTLTAASCIEAVEEVDALDSFCIVDSLESMQGSHAVMDVQIHPLYQGANRSYDLAALRSEDALVHNTQLFRLPTVVEYFLVSLGEKFTLLGYGSYRSIEVSVVGRRVRQVSAYTLSMSQCGDDESMWAVRHLARGAPLAAGACQGGACGPAPLCAGALHSREIPCSYCAGTPLFRAHTLFGVMSDNRQCGVACEPAFYVNIAALRDWIESVIV